MERNEGRRSMTKLQLNSLWGKLGQNPNLSRTIFIDNSKQYKDLQYKEFQGVVDMKSEFDLPDGRKLYSYTDSQGQLELENKNVVVAAFVAAYGRLYLWETLNNLGDRVLYHDTDSVVYEHSKEGPNVEIGYMLGE